MWPFGKRKEDPETSAYWDSLNREAARVPGGYVYSIDDRIGDPMGDVPFCAITGWHKVDDDGKIEGGFQKNEKYDPDQTAEWIAERAKKLH